MNPYPGSKVYHRKVFKSCSIARDKNNERVIKITFPFSEEEIKRIKSIPNRQYHGDMKCWSCPLTTDNINLLMEWGYKVDEKIQMHLRSEREITLDKIKLEIPGLKGTLRDFQKTGVNFIELHKGCALIADEMGLGKTVQSLAWLQLHPELRPAIIVVPASVKINWKREAITWMEDPKIQILSGETPYRITGDIVIINYDVIQYWLRRLMGKGFQVIILDEAHLIKNNDTIRTKSIKKLQKGIPHRIALTGTPVENHPGDVFNAINFVNSSIFPNYWDFMWKYTDPKYERGKWHFSGANNVQELHKILTSSVMLRRLKADVLSELPPKIINFLPLELSNRTEYIEAENNYVEFVRKQKGAAAAEKASNAKALAETEGLKQVAVRGKLKAAIEWIDDYLEIENKLVIVTTHTFVIDELMKVYPKIAVKLDGSVTGEKRQNVVDAFQNDPGLEVMIMNLKAGGVGITLTAACNELILELGWGPKPMEQVEDRIHRMTQTRGVNIYYGLAIGTIEEKIARIIDRKRKMADAVIDGIETPEESLLYELMKEYL
jgi:SWI/SNF-related matrix-associated actin-dependent regulator of chromatin subfamily A-like protein 1